ncbi:MAG TPA: hypothetical protein VGD74_03895 [Vulgatibacter sp.]
MAEARSRAGRVFGALALAMAATVMVAVMISQRLADGPVEPVWDRDACAHCHMHVGDPAFASQIQHRDGRVLHYDDPGCLLEALGTVRDEVHAVWFHHLREDRWLLGDDAGFVRTDPTPMGYGLGAVDRGTTGALSLEEALATVSNAPPVGHSEDGHVDVR